MGRKTPDLAGQQFSRLTILRRDWDAPGPHAKWLCRCTCGTIASVTSNALLSGFTRSCGCLRREMTAARSATHGLAPRHGKPLAYSSWTNMMRRCTHENDPRYPEWGGRGIRVCERWLNFANFLADMGERPPGMTLDRINNDGNYEPGNCRWATPHGQQVNSRNFKLVPDAIAEIRRLRASGLTLGVIAAQTGLHRSTVSRALSGKTRQRSKK